MTTLPRPDVATTTTSDGKDYVVISRDGKARSYEISGSLPSEKIKGVVEKIVNDPYTAEWLP